MQKIKETSSGKMEKHLFKVFSLLVFLTFYGNALVTIRPRSSITSSHISSSNARSHNISSSDISSSASPTLVTTTSIDSTSNRASSSTLTGSTSPSSSAGSTSPSSPLGSIAASLSPGASTAASSGAVILTPTSIMITTPSGFSIETITGHDLIINTWLTTTGSDIILWHLPTITGVDFNFPRLNLPKFSLPCIRVFGVSAGNCPRPIDDDPDDSSSPISPSTPTQGPTSPDQSSRTSSTSSCTQASTVSDCGVTCKPITTSVSQTSITCFTTACSQTVTGCSVTGTTTTTTSTGSCTPGPSGLARRDDGDACDLPCPSFEVPDDGSSTSDDDDLAARGLAPRAAKAVASFGSCALATPVSIPGNPGGIQFWKADNVGFKNANQAPAKAASQAVPRWYSTTVEPATCTPAVVQRDVAAYPDGKNSKSPQRASMDHSWEKGWLTTFFESIIDDNTPPLLGTSGTGNGKISCSDFNNYMFSGTQNLLKAIYDGLPSSANIDQLDFIGMTATLNDNCKGAISNPSRHFSGLNKIIALDVTQGVPIMDALDNMNKKFAQLERIRLGVYMTNLGENKNVADKTNNRLAALMQSLDSNLAAANPNVDPLKQGSWFFTRLFQTYMDNIVSDSPGTIRNQINGYANQLIDDITTKISTISSREQELDDQAPGDWRDLQTKWNYYKPLGSDAYDISLSWSWSCGRKRDGSCALLPSASSTLASSSASSSATSQTSTTTAKSSTQTGSSSGSVVSSTTTTSTGTSSSRPSSFMTTTRTATCTYVTPSVTAGGDPYCEYYIDQVNSVSGCSCQDNKSYAPYTNKDACQPVCPLTSPASGYSQIITSAASATSTTESFQPYTTTDFGGNVQVCTTTSTICVGPTIYTATTATTTASPSSTSVPQCYGGSLYSFDRSDVEDKIQTLCADTQYWKGWDWVLTSDDGVDMYTSDGDSTDDAKVSIVVTPDDAACPEGEDLDSEFATVLNSGLCVDNLLTTVNGCDTDSDKYKHGGILYANCLSWEVRIDPN
ncbi:hypothetical protein GGR56DRAFT_683891 [Xylariaceae sp. FL0804]|nr:hypothetical protein GGR56DRAFT_683891 [Xylariaceae sp. FL0804]